MGKVRNTFKTKSKEEEKVVKHTLKENIDQPENKQSKNNKLSPRRKGQFQSIIGLGLIFTALFILLACISYFFTWQDDQDAVFTFNWSQFFNPEFKANNILGKLGALVSHDLIYLLFGVSSILFSIIYFVFGTNIFARKSLFNTRRITLRVITFIVLSSLILAYSLPQSSFPWGGSFGRYSTIWLEGFIGKIGTGILYFFAALASILVFFDIHLFEAVNKQWSNVKDESIDDEHNSLGDDAAQEHIKIKQAVDTDDLDEGPVVNAFIKKNANQEEEIGASDEDADEEDQIKQNPSVVPSEERNFSEIEEDDDDLPGQSFEIIQPTGEQNATPNHVGQKAKDAATKQTLGLEVEQVHEEAVAQSTNPDFDPTLELSNYQFPTLELLENHGEDNIEINREELEKNKNQIVETLRNYKIEIAKIKATVGPTVTLYEIVPAPGVRISKIKNLEDDIALSLAALGIRIIAPIPGKGTIGIEVPNTHKNVVSMKSMLASKKFAESKADLPVAIGKTISNENYIADLARMPHLLIAGATGQGKSVGINSLLVSLLYKKHPSELKFILIDPKKVELSIYNLIENHFLAKLPGEEEAIITDTTKVIDTLNSLCIEMDQRYDLLKNAHCRNIKEYNKKFKERRLNPEKGHHFLPYIVLVIDEFADLIMTAGKEVESPIARLAQLARAVGIHLIIATQRPSVNIITGIIKANFPARIAFRVMSKIDSRTILDMGGADQLIGRGDLILSIGSDAVRLQCPFVDTPEVEDITRHIAEQQSFGHAYELPEYSSEESAGSLDEDESLDDLFFDAARMVVQNDSGSTSMLQRRLKLGYNRAGRIMDQLERAGIVGPQKGSKPREVLYFDEVELERYLENLK